MLTRQWLTARIKIEEYFDDFDADSKEISYRVDDISKSTIERIMNALKDDSYKVYYPHESFVIAENDEQETVKFINWTIPDRDYTPVRSRKHYRQFVMDFINLEAHFPELKECVIRDLQWFLLEKPTKKFRDYDEYRRPKAKLPRLYRVSRKKLAKLGIESRPAPKEDLPM